jgi:hypothetical protein
MNKNGPVNCNTGKNHPVTKTIKTTEKVAYHGIFFDHPFTQRAKHFLLCDGD